MEEIGFDLMVPAGSPQHNAKPRDVRRAGQRFVRSVLDESANGILLVFVDHNHDWRWWSRRFLENVHQSQNVFVALGSDGGCIQKDCIRMLARVNHAPGTVQIVVANLVAGSQSSPYNFCETLVPAVEPEPDNFFSHPAIPHRKVANAPGRGSFVTSQIHHSRAPLRNGCSAQWRIAALADWKPL